MTWTPTCCPICGETKPVRWDMCRSCLQEHGDRDRWPGWLHAVISDERRVRWQVERSWSREIDVPPGELDAEGVWGWPEQLRSRPLSELAVSGDSHLLLPHSPYDDEETNRQYRISNRIKED